MKYKKLRCVGGAIAVVRRKFNSSTKTFDLATTAEKFIKGPIPYEWKRKANGLPGKAGAVADGLMFLRGVQQTSTVKLTSEVEVLAACERRALYSSLRNLEKAGMVKVHRKRGARPWVEIIL